MSTSKRPSPLVTSSPNKMSGALVFVGRRVPVRTLFDYLEAGKTIEYFTAQFPDVTREHATAILDLAQQRLADTVGNDAAGLKNF
jgi:uncharacterized protein (DUF433 family)